MIVDILAAVLVFVLVAIVVGLPVYLMIRFLTIDWFGLKYEDKDSAYYHDKLGQGRGHK